MLYEQTAYLDDFPIQIRIVNIEEYPIHYHQDVEIVYVLSGEIALRNGYCNYLLKAGDIFTNSGHEVHSLMGTGRDNIIAIFQISNHFFTQYFPNMNMACYFTYANRDLYLQLDALRKMLLEILLDYTRKSFDYKSRCTRRMINVIQYLNENFNLFAFEDNVIVNFKNDNPVIVERISNIINYIYTNHASKVTLEELADREHLSTYYISHLIRNYVGISFQGMLGLARSELSEIPLLETTKKISTIGREEGFSTTANYNQCFRKWFGLTPEEHRRQCLPLVLSEHCPAILHVLPEHEAISCIKQSLSMIHGQDHNASRVTSTQVNLTVVLDGPVIQPIDHRLNILISMEDYDVLGERLFAELYDLHPRRITLLVQESDSSSGIRQLEASLNGYAEEVILLPQRTVPLSGAFGYDSIASYIHIFHEYVLTKESLIPCRLRDQGSLFPMLKGCTSCLTAGGIRKPAFYAYQHLSRLTGEVLLADKYYTLVRTLSPGEPTRYILTALNFNDEIENLCQRNASLHEVNDILNDFVDELSFEFNLALPSGTYNIMKFSLSNDTSLFHYVAQLGFPKDGGLVQDWSTVLGTQPHTFLLQENVVDTLNINLTIQGVGVQVAVIERFEQR